MSYDPAWTPLLQSLVSGPKHFDLCRIPVHAVEAGWAMAAAGLVTFEDRKIVITDAGRLALAQNDRAKAEGER